MRIVIVKWFSIAALLFAVLSWTSPSTYQLALGLFVSMAAAVLALQEFRARKTQWLNSQILFSIASITDRTPGSQSL
jgi:hypothetical protein